MNYAVLYPGALSENFDDCRIFPVGIHKQLGNLPGCSSLLTQLCCLLYHQSETPVKILNRVLVENWERGMMLAAACRHKGSKIGKIIQMADHYIWHFSGMKRSFICLWGVTLYHVNPHDMHCFTLHQLLFKRHDSVCGPMKYTVCPLSNDTAFVMKTWWIYLEVFMTDF